MSELGATGEAERELPLQELPRRSTDTAQRLAVQLVTTDKAEDYGEDETFKISLALVDLANVGRIRKDSAQVLHYADQLAFIDPKFAGSKVAELYFDATCLDNETASQKLHDLLQEEREESEREIDDNLPKIGQLAYGALSSSLIAVVAVCAEEGIQADSWIENYAIGPQKDYMKMQYATSDQPADSDGADIAERYRQEETTKFLQGQGMDREFAFTFASNAVDMQRNDDDKLKVFHRFQDISNDMPVTQGTFEKYLEISQKAINAKIINDNELEAIVATADLRRDILVADGISPLDLDISLGNLKLSIAQYKHAPYQEIIQIIDKNLQLESQQADDLIRNTDEEVHGLINVGRDINALGRDIALGNQVRISIQQGDLQRAVAFIGVVEDNNLKKAFLEDCLRQAKTLDDIALLKPRDEMELLFDDELRVLFDTYETLLDFKRDNVTQHAEYDGNRTMTWLIKHCIEVGYEHGREDGSSIASNVVQAFSRRHAEPTNFIEVGFTQMQSGDPQGLYVLYDQAGRAPTQVEQFKEYANVAYLSTKEVYGKKAA